MRISRRSISVIMALLLVFSIMPITKANAATDAPSTWATTLVERAISLDIVPEKLQSKYTQPTTRTEFCSMAVRLIEKINGREITARAEFMDTIDSNVQKMGGLGIVNGVGDNKFAPEATISREQSAVILANLMEEMDYPLDEIHASFSDSSAISSWALTAVGQVQAGGIMSGVGENIFSPKAIYTREQSIVTLLRVFDLLTIGKPVKVSSLTPVASYGNFQNYYKYKTTDVLGNTHKDCLTAYSVEGSWVLAADREKAHSGVFNLEKKYSELTGTLFIPQNTKNDYTGVIKIYDNDSGTLLAEYSIFYFDEPSDFSVDVTGVRLLRVQLDASASGGMVGVSKLMLHTEEN